MLSSRWVGILFVFFKLFMAWCCFCFMAGFGFVSVGTLLSAD